MAHVQYHMQNYAVASVLCSAVTNHGSPVLRLHSNG